MGVALVDARACVVIKTVSERKGALIDWATTETTWERFPGTRRLGVTTMSNSMAAPPPITGSDQPAPVMASVKSRGTQASPFIRVP